MTLIGDDYTTGDGLTLSVSLVLLEIPNEAWIKQVLISAFNTLTIEENWSDDYGDITTDQATRVMSLMLQTLQFDYEPPPMTPIGGMMEYAGSVVPDAWLLCDGQAVSRTTYAELFAQLGITWGAGDGVTTFNVPNLIDRSPMGAGGSIVPTPTQLAGAATHTLITSEIPSHNHGVTDPGHNHQPSGATVFQGSNAGGSTGFEVDIAGQTRVQITNTTTNTTGISIQNTGGDGEHNNIHPVVGVTYIIYAGV